MINNVAQDYIYTDKVAISSAEDCKQYFHNRVSPPDKKILGLEYELILIDKLTTLFVPYFGPRGLSKVLYELTQYHYEIIMDDGCIMGLRRDQTCVSLEPGGQLEFSSSPCLSAHEISLQLNQFLSELFPICERLGIAILMTGYRPFGQPNLVDTIPRSRYVTLLPHLEKFSAFSNEQKMTASIQVSLDYHSQSHAGKSLLLASKCQPYIVALFANSPVNNGVITAMKSYRMFTWSRFTPDRSGIPWFLFEKDFVKNAFSYYTEWAISRKLLFIIRNDKLISVENITFKEFLQHGYDSYEPQLGDWEVHLGTLFPEARLKNVVEVRSADTCSPSFAVGLAAFWKGLLYDNMAMDEALAILRAHGKRETEHLYQQAYTKGMGAITETQHQFIDILSNLLNISQKGLERISNYSEDIIELETLSYAVKNKQFPADDFIRGFNGSNGIIDSMSFGRIEG